MKSSAGVKLPDYKGFPPLNTRWQQKWLGLAQSHPKLQEAADEVQKFAADWFANRPARRLVLTGSTGCGKTELEHGLARYARAASFNAWESGFYTRPASLGFILWTEICDRLEDSRAHMTEVLADAIQYDLLIVDDIGAETDRFKSGKGIDALCYLLTRRQDRGHTLLSTNVPPAEWRSRWDPRVEDRLLRNSTISNLKDCPSWATL